MHEAFEMVINNVFYWIIWFFELLGAVVIVFGVIYSIGKLSVSAIKHKNFSLKVNIANYLSIGLELMLVAEVLKTVITQNRTLDEFIILAAIILLRATLSLLIHWELKTEEKRIDVDDKRTKRLVKKD